MARVFLLNPATAEPIRTPLLAFAYLAAALRRAGHEVALLDASAPFAPKAPEAIAERVRAFEPTLVGIHAKTLFVQDSYALAAALRTHGLTAPLVCGGPHPTVVPREPLSHGFDFAVVGEGEETLPELADALDGRRPLSNVRSLIWRGPDGSPVSNPARGFLADLDALASPLEALELFDPAWYGASRPVSPAGLLSSRGCPAACTFCSNNVTGRVFRHRSPEAVCAEISRLQETTGLDSFSFFDDSFAVGRQRVETLCAALEALPRQVHWSCTAHPAHLHRDLLVRMQRAGCTSVDIGMESGDPDMLLRIGKGVTVARVQQVLRDAREIGLHCMLNLMFGWPDETDQELGTTLAFLQEAAPLAASFNARGVLVPYPGTEVYERHHMQFGFTEWWLREPPLRYEPFPEEWSLEGMRRAYSADAALARNFFQLPPATLALIQRGLDLKVELTHSKIAAGCYGFS